MRAICQLAQRTPGDRIAPARGDRGGGPEHEVPFAEQRMGNLQVGLGIGPAAPQHDVEIERAVAPALARAPTAEFALEAFQPGEQAGRIERAVEQHGGVGEAALRGADRIARDDRAARGDRAQRGEFLHRRAHDVARVAEGAQPPVRPQRDEVEVAQISSQMRP